MRIQEVYEGSFRDQDQRKEKEGETEVAPAEHRQLPMGVSLEICPGLG